MINYTKTALQVCPFCGSDSVGVCFDGIWQNYYVHCSECDATGGKKEKIEDAITVWNRRNNNDREM